MGGLEELAAVFDIQPNEYKVFKKTLRMMEAEGLIVKTKRDRYKIREEGETLNYDGLVIGKLEVHQRGFGFLIPDEEGQKDVFIPSNAMRDAMNGDKVAVKVTREDKNDKKREGQVVDVLERNVTKVIGVYEDSRNFGFVISEDTRISRDIYIPKRDRNGANDGDVVVVKITKYPAERRKPEGVVTEILGKKGDRGIDILTIIKKNGLPEEFPEKVLRYADNISEEITKEDMKGRTDLRNLRMITIDGEDAKDLDDAVSIEKLSNGNYKLGVHIADVTNYVRENNQLDREALKRATSVYLIDRVIPMLPRKLSNGICSLNPQVDRLTLTCFMEINSKGKVVEHEIVESLSLIHISEPTRPLYISYAVFCLKKKKKKKPSI
eukprot:TRINITY_DN11206_c0_g1_i3.p1 TRINITY_DN11206_c0_g1~~TRINITY_DN11206_c0_g1_i3.p1  ORF type:complete len:380 (-),score=83.96 TRINITY_DN11206_c0_g1_i3:105-1244(-)